MIGLVPTSIRLIPQSEVARLLDLDRLLDSLEQAFKALSAGATSVPPRTAARVPGERFADPLVLRSANQLVASPTTTAARR